MREDDVVAGARSLSRTVFIGVACLLLAVLWLAASATDALAQTTRAFQSDASRTFASETDVTINDAGPATPYPSTLNVSGLNGTITDVDVVLEGVSHTYSDDIDVLLVGPGGQKSVLMSDAGTFGDLGGVALTFDDEASQALPDETPISPGAYRPTDHEGQDAYPPPAPSGPHAASLAAFDGTNPNGEWRLFVMDGLVSGVGGISGYSLKITTTRGISIPFNGPATPYPAPLTIGGLGNEVVTDVDVVLEGVSHTHPRDLDVLLMGPGGQKSVLMSDAGGGEDLTGASPMFDDEAPLSLPEWAQISSDVYKPTDRNGSQDFYLPPAPAGPHAASLAQLDGSDLNGQWRLFVMDNSNPERGSISGYTLSITSQPAADLECADGLDNDGDGRADVAGNDAGCLNRADDTEGSDRLSVADEAIVEGTGGSSTALRFTVRLAEPLARQVGTNWETENRTAAAPGDFAAASGAVIFAPGQTEKTFAVGVVADGADEPDETFKVNLWNANAQLVRGRATGTIEDDDEPPPNAAPTADADSYSTPEGQTLRVAAPGVLEGDADPDSDPLTAAEVTEAAHGEVFARADGSFAYVPNGGFVGTDAFAYKASDGKARSAPAAVTITVTDATAPTVLSTTPSGRRVSPSSTVTATFSEEMEEGSVRAGGVVRLTKKGSTAAVPAAVSYDAATRRVTLDPTRALKKGATYRATITTGAEDLAGNPLAKSRVWSFTVRR